MFVDAGCVGADTAVDFLLEWVVLDDMLSVFAVGTGRFGDLCPLPVLRYSGHVFFSSLSLTLSGIGLCSFISFGLT